MGTELIDWDAREKAFAHNDAATHLHKEAFALWCAMAVAYRMPIYQGRIFVLWTFDGEGTPRVFDALHVVNLDGSFKGGLRVQVQDWQGRRQVVGQVPTPIFDHELFMWLPYRNDVRWVPHPQDERDKSLRCAVVMRTRSHPDKSVIGDTFITDVGSFRKQFPAFAGQKF